MSAEKAEVTVEDSIKQAMAEVEEKHEEANEEASAEIPEDAGRDRPTGRDRDEGGKFVKQAKEKTEEAAPEKINQEIAEKPQAETQKPDAAPQSWGAGVKAEWNTLPPTVKAEIHKRESDIHQMMTRHDGELRLGREMKEVTVPYMALIQAEGGGSLASVVQGLLNTAYQLRTSSPEQKAQVVQKICETYGVPLQQFAQVNQQQAHVNPEIKQVMDRLSGIEQKFTHQSTLQKQEEDARVTSEIQAFAANPANTYFEQVRTHMGALFGSGQAKDLQEAYDAACWANPQIRSVLIAAQETAAAEKRKTEIAQKKKASASVTGSPGLNASSTPSKTHKSAEESVREVFDDLMASKI